MKRILGLLLLFLLLGGALLSLASTKEDHEVEEEITIDEPLHYISHIQQAAKTMGLIPLCWQRLQELKAAGKKMLKATWEHVV